MASITKLFIALFIIRLSVINYIKYSTSFPTNLPNGIEFIAGIGTFLFFKLALHGISKFHMKVFNTKSMEASFEEKNSNNESSPRTFLIGLTFVILLIVGFVSNILAMAYGSMGGLTNQLIEISSLCAASFFMVAGFFAFATPE